MATAQFKFTLARLKDLSATGKLYTARDSETPHLQCIVSATGKQTLQIYRRVKGHSTPVRVKIQHVATMKQIRAEADRINALMSSGINPNQQGKIDAALQVTLQDAFDKYIAAKNLRENTKKSYNLALDQMDDWKDKPLTSINKVMVLDLYTKVAANSHSSAMKVAQVLRAVWHFSNDLTDDDAFGIPPTTILNKQKKKWSRATTRNRKITTDDLPAWFKAVRAMHSSKTGDGERMASYLEFLILTGLRRREAGHLLWKDVNLKAGYFIVRKTKNHSDHCLPITTRTRQLLNSMRDNGEHVFGVEEPKKAIKRVINACDVVFSCHDLRRTFATMADHSGAGIYAIKGILNHASGGDVTGAHYAGYHPLDDAGNVNLDEVRVMYESLQKIEDYILRKAKVKNNILRAIK
jgi:integrase